MLSHLTPTNLRESVGEVLQRFRVESHTNKQEGKEVNFFFRGGERDGGVSLACSRGVEEHGLETQKQNITKTEKKQHKKMHEKQASNSPGRNSSESKTIVNVTQSQSCRLAVICGPLLPIPIHSVRMEFLDCFSSTLWLREIRQKFVFLPKALSFKEGAPCLQGGSTRGRGLKKKKSVDGAPRGDGWPMKH